MNFLPSFDLESVVNLTHRAALKALIETDLPVVEIADRVKITRVNIYSIVGRYLPKNFMRLRSKAIKDAKFASTVSGDKNSTPIFNENDLVEVISLSSSKAPVLEYEPRPTPELERSVKGLTPRQQTIYDILEDYYNKTGFLMPHSEVNAAFYKVYGSFAGNGTISSTKHIWSLSHNLKLGPKAPQLPVQPQPNIAASPIVATKTPSAVIDYHGIRIELNSESDNQADCICKILKQLSDINGVSS